MSRIANILLVEDDDLEVIQVQRTLKKKDVIHNLYIARNGIQAYSMLKGIGQEKIPYPDVVLLDISMPMMTGIEFLKKVRMDEALKELRVFMLTTSNDPQDRIEANQLGTSGFIVKPLGSSTLDNYNLFIDLMNLK